MTAKKKKKAAKAESPQKTTRLFVYGTLMRGEANAEHLQGARFVGPALTEPAYSLLDLGDYPTLRAGGKTAVAGELYEVGPEIVAHLDRFEDHPQQYRRRSVRLDDGSEAQAYLLPPGPLPDAAVIASGDWRRRG